jgi:hypothetical protein
MWIRKQQKRAVVPLDVCDGERWKVAPGSVIMLDLGSLLLKEPVSQTLFDHCVHALKLRDKPGADPQADHEAGN